MVTVESKLVMMNGINNNTIDDMKMDLEKRLQAGSKPIVIAGNDMKKALRRMPLVGSKLIMIDSSNGDVIEVRKKAFKRRLMVGSKLIMIDSTNSDVIDDLKKAQEESKII